MKKNILLVFAMLASVAMQAQVILQENFASDPREKDPSAVGYAEFINIQEGDEWTVNTTPADNYNAQDGSGRLEISNSDAVEGATWQRAIKFRNLPIEENKAYRVKIGVMGTNEYKEGTKSTIRFALMQGGENLDCGFVLNGTEQLADISRFQTIEEAEAGEKDGYMVYEQLFRYGTVADQTKWYAEKNPTKDPLPATYFLTINCYNPGKYYITDVTIEEALVKSCLYSFSALCIDLGVEVNKAELLKGGKYYLFDPSCAKVMWGEDEMTIKTVELKQDGKLYIFLEDEIDEYEEGVVVTFNNPGELKYADGTVVPALTNIASKFDENEEIQEYCSTMVPPTLVSVDPEEGSFDLPADMSTFTFTFDKNVDLSKVTATLSDEFGTDETLTVDGEGLASTVVVKRSAATALKGLYTIALDNVYAEEVLDGVEAVKASVEVNFGKTEGGSTEAVVIFTEDFTQVLSDGTFANTAWTRYRNGEVEDANSGCRILNNVNGIFAGKGVFYIGNRDNGVVTTTYGEREGKPLTLEADKYALTFNYGGWDGNNIGAFRVNVKNANGDVIATKFEKVEYNIKGGMDVPATCPVFELKFNVAAAGDYVIEIIPRNGDDGEIGGWTACAFGNVKLETVPSAAGAVEKKALADALTTAKGTLETCAGDRYAGPAATALAAAVEKYDGQSFTAPSVYAAAVKELEDATKALLAHKELCDTYDPLVQKAIDQRDASTRLGTKFERSEEYTNICAAITKYEGKVLTDDVELAAAIKELQNSTTAYFAIGRTTENELKAMVYGLDELKRLGAENAPLRAEVNDLLVADAEVAAKVQNDLKLLGYKTAINNEFAKFDEVIFEDVKDSIDMRAFIVNPEVYNTTWDEAAVSDKLAPEGTTILDPASDNIPGWNIEVSSRGWGFTYHYPWGADKAYRYQEGVIKNADGMIASWGTAFEMSQEINGLPEGVYTLVAGASERTDDHTIASYAYAQTNDVDMDPVTFEEAPKVYTAMLPMLGGGTEPNFTNGSPRIAGIVVKDGYLKIGVHVDAIDHPFVNTWGLYMTGKLDDFDYEAAYTPTKGVKDADEAKVKSVRYVTLGGAAATASTPGVIVKITEMTDGTVKADKIIK